MFMKSIPRHFLARNSGAASLALSNKGRCNATNSAFLYMQRQRQQLQQQTYATAEASSQTHSYLRGETDASIDHTIGYQLSQNAREIPFDNAFRSSHQDISWSFTELKKHTEAFASTVIELGLRPGDRMLLYSGSSAEQIIAMGACAKAGAILVQAQQIKDEKELSRYMELFRPRIVAVPFRIQKTDTLKLLKSTFPELQHREDVGELFTPLKSKKFSYCKHILLLQDGMAEKQKGSNLFFDAIVYGPSGYYESPLRRIAMTMTPDDPVLILLDDKDVHSARPIVFSHRNLLNAGHLIAQKADIKHGDRVVVTHRQQNMLGTLASYSCLVSRATLIFPAPLFDAKECLKQIDEEQATVLFGSADELKELLDVKEGLDLKLPHLKTVVVDSSATSDAISGFEERFGIKVVHVSGINEASGAMLIDNQISNNTEFKIARAHDGKIVHRDTYGDLKIRGPTVARGWWNDIGLMNPDIDEDGWFNTGRVAKIDANGNLDMQ